MTRNYHTLDGTVLCIVASLPCMSYYKLDIHLLLLIMMSLLFLWCWYPVDRCQRCFSWYLTFFPQFGHWGFSPMHGAYYHWKFIIRVGCSWIDLMVSWSYVAGPFT